MNAASSPSVAQLFTAAEYAKVLRCAPQYVRKQLKHTPVAGKKLPRSQSKLADAWEIGSLPSPLIQRLTKLAQKVGYKSPLELMQNPPSLEGVKSLARVADAEISRAQKLLRAFSSCLAMPAETSISERARIAAPHYKREFGKQVSDRYLRKLIARLLEADAGRRNFADLTIYVPKERARKRAKRSPISGRFDFRELDQHFVAIPDRTTVGLRHIAFAWRKVVEFFFARVAAGADEVPLKRELCAHLLTTAPFLSDSPAAMKRNLDRKLRFASERGVESITDRRLNPLRPSKKPTDFDENIKLCAKHSVLYCLKREAQAHRQLHEGTTPNGERYSEEFRKAYPLDVRRAKSRVPTIVRRAVTPLVKNAWPHHLGPRAVRDARPKRQRDWAGVYAGDYYIGDDATANHYGHEFRLDGEYECEEGRFNFGRLQWLPIFDELTTLVLGVAVALEARPDQWSVFEGISRVLLNPGIGMPHVGLTLEFGAYDTHLIRQLETTFIDAEEEFARQGLQLKINRVHSATAKSQAEGPIGRLQNLFDYGPGYVGRNERDVRFEGIQRLKGQLKKFGQPRKEGVHPAQMTMSLDQYEAELAGVIRRYNHEVQNGRLLRDRFGLGLSPSEAWDKFSRNCHHKVLPDSLRYRLAGKPYEQKVTIDGVRVPSFKGKELWFRSEKLSLLLGEKVRLRFNPQTPDHVTICHLATDPREKSPFSVPVVAQVRAKGATGDDFEASRAGEGVICGRTIYREFVPSRNTTISDMSWGTPAARAIGEARNRVEREHIELSASRDRERASISRLAASQGRAINPRNLRDPERVKKNLESAERREQRILELEQESAEISAGEEKSK